MGIVKYPHVTVRLVGTNSNAFSVMGAVTKSLRCGGADRAELDAFQTECMSADYDHLLRTCMRWVNVE
jgi:hypothetical protein